MSILDKFFYRYNKLEQSLKDYPAEAEEMRRVLWLHFFLQLWNNSRRTPAWVVHLSENYLGTEESHCVKESGERTQYKSSEELHYSGIYLAQVAGQYVA